MPTLMLNDRRTPHRVAGTMFEAEIPVEVADIAPYQAAIKRHELVVIEGDAPVETPNGDSAPSDPVPSETKAKKPKASARANAPADNGETKPTE